jgi:hypothetical protein
MGSTAAEPIGATRTRLVSKEITDTVTDTHGSRFGTGPVEGPLKR